MKHVTYFINFNLEVSIDGPFVKFGFEIIRAIYSYSGGAWYFVVYLVTSTRFFLIKTL